MKKEHPFKGLYSLMQLVCMFAFLQITSCSQSKTIVPKDSETLTEDALGKKEKENPSDDTEESVNKEELPKIEEKIPIVIDKLIIVDEIPTSASPLTEERVLTSPKPISAPTVIHSIDKYKVGLEANSVVKLGRPFTLKVLVGPEDITLSFSNNGKVNDEIVISTKKNQYAIITPHTPGFDVEPVSTGCILLDSSEIGYLFELTPTAIGTFEISANVELFNGSDCEGSKTAAIASELEITVEVAAQANATVTNVTLKTDEEETTWESIQALFKEHLLKFVGGIFTLFFGYLLFFIRKKLKKKTGYDDAEKEA